MKPNEPLGWGQDQVDILNPGAAEKDLITASTFAAGQEAKKSPKKVQQKPGPSRSVCDPVAEDGTGLLWSSRKFDWVLKNLKGFIN